MHGQSGTTALPSYNPQNIVQPFDTHGGIASSSTNVEIGDAAPSVGNQLAHLNLAIREVDLIDANGNSTVLAQYAEPLIVDILQYQDGSGATVARGGNAKPKTYTQVRIVVEAAESQAIYTDNSTGALNFSGDSSASSVGAGLATATAPGWQGTVAITTPVNFTTQPNLNNTLKVDFNAFESLAPGASTAVTVRPTLFAAAASSAGTITGTVVGKNGKPVANATVIATGSDGSVGNTVATDASGNFNLHALNADTYSLQVRNSYTNAAGANIVSQGGGGGTVLGPTVTVTPGQTTDAGTIRD